MQSQGNVHKDERFMGTEVNLVKIRTLAQTSSLSLECQASSKEDDGSSGLCTFLHFIPCHQHCSSANQKRYQCSRRMAMPL